MKILIVGGTGTMGTAVAEALNDLDHEVIIASKTRGDVQVDLESTDSITQMYQKVPHLDAVVAAPSGVKQLSYASEQTIEDYQNGMVLKGFGQINLVLVGQNFLNPGGSFTLTTGILTTGQVPKTSAVATVNGAIEGFVRGSSGELNNYLRINAISPDVVVESLDKLKELFVGSEGIPVESAAQAYVRAVTEK